MTSVLALFHKTVSPLDLRPGDQGSLMEPRGPQGHLHSAIKDSNRPKHKSQRRCIPTSEGIGPLDDLGYGEHSTSFSNTATSTISISQVSLDLIAIKR